MFCSQCGKQLGKGDRFCSGCGSPITDTTDLNNSVDVSCPINTNPQIEGHYNRETSNSDAANTIDNHISKTKCDYSFGKIVTIKNNKLHRAKKGHITADSSRLKLIKTQHNTDVPLMVAVIFALFNLGLGIAGALGAGCAAFLIASVVVIIINGATPIKVDKRDIIKSSIESDPQRIVLELTNGKNLAITGDDELLMKISCWMKST